jgi:UDP-glucose 4-epimerase
VWAAGAAGFGASQSEAEKDLDGFGDVIDLAVRVRTAGAPTVLHVVSSAGGLYEGGHQVDVSAAPSPRRPYGHMKVEQERLAIAQSGDIAVEIYRPSSVYTAPGGGRRAGLVGVLLGNGTMRRPSTIIGALDTVRDYVHARDVGRHIAQAIATPTDRDGVNVSMLVAAEPVSIARVVREVEHIIRRPLLLEIRDAWNAEDITFSKSVRPVGFRPMSLVEGMNATYLAIRTA